VTLVHGIAAAGRTTGMARLSIQSQEKTMPRRSFDEVVLPHLVAAFNYARWLTKNDADAEDVVQDAYVRALRFFSSLRGEEARAWLLTIVRNTWYGRFPRRAGSATDTHETAEGDLFMYVGARPSRVDEHRRTVRGQVGAQCFRHSTRTDRSRRQGRADDKGRLRDDGLDVTFT
jgi:DNA-directed RNA polymerase specialized sigma24 family protein